MAISWFNGYIYHVFKLVEVNPNAHNIIFLDKNIVPVIIDNIIRSIKTIGKTKLTYPIIRKIICIYPQCKKEKLINKFPFSY